MRDAMWVFAAGLTLLLLAGPATVQAAEDDVEVPPDIAAFLGTLPEFADTEAVRTALLDSAENWPELAGALERCVLDSVRGLKPGELAVDAADYDNLVWLLATAPHLDRLELTADILIENLALAQDAAELRSYDRTSDFFRRYVLNYRLDEEPVTAWRAELARRYKPAPNHRSSWDALIAALVLGVTTGLTEYERGYYGNLADPLSVDNARGGTGRELALLTAATLRAQGLGTRFVREDRSGQSWVEVYIGDPQVYDAGAWLPVYPSAPDRSGDTAYATELCEGRIAVVTAGDAFGREQVTARYAPVCGFIPRFTRAGESQPGFEHWSVTAWADGYYIALDDLGYPLGELDYPEGSDRPDETTYYLGAPGEYRFQCGTRYPGAVVHVQTRDFAAEPGGLVVLDIELDPPSELPATALVERKVDWTLPGEDEALRAMGSHLILVVDDAEPSVRATGLLERFSGDERVSFSSYSLARADAETAAWIKGELRVRDDDPLPVVILVHDGETLVYRRGFDLNIADWVERALRAASTTP